MMMCTCYSVIVPVPGMKWLDVLGCSPSSVNLAFFIVPKPEHL